MIRNKSNNRALYYGMLGFIIGDAMGVPVEFSLRSDLLIDPVTGFREYGTHNQPAGTWSDDTSMTIATIAAMTNILREQPGKKDVLIKNPSLTAQRVMNEFIGWMETGVYACGGEVFDIGMTISQVLHEFKKSKNIYTCGSKEEEENGNGALMRMLPIAIYLSEIIKDDSPTPKEEYEILNFIYLLCGITHNHERNKLACLIYVELVISLINNPNLKLEAILKDGFIKGRNRYLKYADEFHMSGNEVIHYKNIDKIIEGKYNWNNIKSSGYVVDTLEAVFFSLLSTTSFEECILKAVNLGDDTDTIAAIAGSIAGIYYGIKNGSNEIGIPEQWIYELRDLSKIKEILVEFMTVLSY